MIFNGELSLTLLITGSVFAGASTLIVYHHFGYPLMLHWLSKGKRFKNQPVAPVLYPINQLEGHWPAITLVIPVYNEQRYIAEKIRNLAILDYPADKLTVLMIFDGCSDHSALVARETLSEDACQHLNCILEEDPVNRGKLQQLNRHIPQCNSEIIALSDLSALITADALKLASVWFQSKTYGVVCGTYKFFSNAGNQEQSYWQYQCTIKQAESNLGSTLGAHGAFYLIRKSLFRPVPADTINDDFYLPCDIIRQGYRVVYDPRIVAIELENSSLDYDFKRRLRISAGNMQQSLRLTDLLKPSYGLTGWMFFSCKWLRPFIPWCFLICLASAALMSVYHLAFLPLLLLQLAVYALVMIQQYFSLNNPVMKKLHYLISGHFIGLLGGINYLRGNMNAQWKKV